MSKTPVAVLVARNLFVGKKIANVRYLTQSEADQLGWDSRAIVFILEDGTAFFPSRDNEGNDAGAIFTNLEDLQVIPASRG